MKSSTYVIPMAMTAVAFFNCVQPAWADMHYPAYGGAGDIQNGLICPNGQYLKGLRGNAGKWIDRLKIMCAPLESGGHVGGSKTLNGAGGGGGAEQAKSLCTDSIVTEVVVYLTNDRRMVAHIEGNCKSLVTGKVGGRGQNVSFGASGWSGAQKFYQSCSSREAAVGFDVHWGEHLNAVGLVCKDLVIPR